MITEINYRNFRGHNENFKFGPNRNIIKGPNEAGKSTIKEAIAFTWMSTDSQGTKNPDHLITVGQDIMDVQLKTAKAAFWRKKKRGSTSEVKLQREGIPDVKLSQSDLMNQIGVSHEVFMSSWLVGYFMELKSDTKLKVLGEIAKINREDMLKELVGDTPIPSQLKYKNPKIDADVVAGMRRSEQNQRQSFEAAQASIRTQLTSFPTEVLQIDPQEYSAKIAHADALLQQHSAYKNQLQVWKVESDKRASAGKMTEDLKQQIAKEQESLNTYLNPLAFAESAKEDTKSQAVAYEQKIQELLKSKKIIELQVPPKPNAKSGKCPTCLTEVSEEHVHMLMDPYNKSVEEYNKHSRLVADHNQKIDAEVLEIQKIIAEIRQNYLKADAESSRLKTLKIKGEAAIDNLRKQLQQYINMPKDVLQTPQVPDGSEDEIKSLRDKLKAELHSYNLFVTQKKQLDEQLQSNQTKIDHHLKVATQLAKVEAALLQLPELETAATLEKVSVPGIMMSLQEGDLIVTNEDGVDYRCLSDGRRMKVDTAICLAIKKAEPKSPDWIFVDNSDLMDQEVYIPDGVQVLIAKVDSTVDTVEVVSL